MQADIDLLSLAINELNLRAPQIFDALLGCFSAYILDVKGMLRFGGGIAELSRIGR